MKWLLNVSSMRSTLWGESSESELCEMRTLSMSYMRWGVSDVRRTAWSEPSTCEHSLVNHLKRWTVMWSHLTWTLWGEIPGGSELSSKLSEVSHLWEHQLSVSPLSVSLRSVSQLRWFLWYEPFEVSCLRWSFSGKLFRCSNWHEPSYWRGEHLR